MGSKSSKYVLYIEMYFFYLYTSLHIRDIKFYCLRGLVAEEGCGSAGTSILTEAVCAELLVLAHLEHKSCRVNPGFWSVIVLKY